MPLPAPRSSEAGGSTVYAADGTTVLAVLHASEERKPVALSQVSQTLITAVLDTEDHRFYLHGGFDIPSTIRALAADTSGSGLQGGSTITQQLVKQTYLTSERTLPRKIKEAVLADRLEQKYTKNQILAGIPQHDLPRQRRVRHRGCSRDILPRDGSQLTCRSRPCSAGLIQNPSGYDPHQRPDRAAGTRRAEVLARMVHYGDITQAQAAAANPGPCRRRVEPPVRRRQHQQLLRPGR